MSTELAEKACRNCHVVKALETGFSKTPQNRDGYAGACKACKVAITKAWRVANLEKAKEGDRRRSALHRQRNPTYAKFLKVRQRYGLSEADWRVMYDRQDGKCASCTDVFQDMGAVCVDHDHVTGAIRGLLCSPCNIGLGSFRDSPERLELAAAYLRSVSDVR